jgi:hypothetical protein
MKSAICLALRPEKKRGTGDESASCITHGSINIYFINAVPTDDVGDEKMNK